MNPQAPIGIFDSGIGGLTVADAIHKLLPGEKLIYFGDTAHLPYGDKAPESIRNYSKHIADFLLRNGCKMIVIACNTASSIAYDTVVRHVGKKAMVADVINPVVAAVTARKDFKKIGVIGTRATIKSEAYPKRITAIRKKMQVVSVATPLLAPMIEEGFFNNKISRTIINSYLSRPKLKNIESIILACTHYPLIRPEIEEYYKDKVEIVDSAQIVAAYVAAKLAAKNLLADHKRPAHKFFVSDYTESFEKSTRLFFSGKIKLEKRNLWK